MKRTLSIMSSAVVAALLVAACDKGERNSSAEKAPQQAAEETKDVNSITIRPELAPRIKVGYPTMIDLADKLQVPSRVEVDEERLVRVGSYVTGRIID